MKMNYEEALKIALKIAIEKHKGQKRKVNNEDFIIHPIAVANKFDREQYKIIAILHNTIEDTDLTLDDLRNRGLDEDSIIIIDILTRKPYQSYLDYILLVRGNEIATAIKIEDLKHNLLSSNLISGHFSDKYLMALYILTGEKD